MRRSNFKLNEIFGYATKLLYDGLFEAFEPKMNVKNNVCRTFIEKNLKEEKEKKDSQKMQWLYKNMVTRKMSIFTWVFVKKS